MSEKNFYILKYTDKDAGCPTYLSAELTPSETEWEIFVANPFDISVNNKYILRITDSGIKYIDFDMDSGDQKYVSENFLKVCDTLSVSYRAIPFEMVFANGKSVLKNYFFFLPGENIELLNREKSDFVEEKVLGSNEIEMNGVFPACPIYSKIEKFIPRTIHTSNLFFCIEIFELVCTDDFRRTALEQKLTGIDFLLINERYKYDPWND